MRRQGAVCALLGDSELNWRITDLITLGSPLVHAEFLAVDSRQDLEQAFEERLLSASPPRPDQGKSSMLYRAEGAAPGKDRGPFPHFAAPFCAVRWTNIFDDHVLPWFGDLVSGPVRGIFGPGIEEHQVKIRRPGWLGLFARTFTHTHYWTWHEDYDPEKPPYHICLLRRALNLSGTARSVDCSDAGDGPKATG
jgi:hypothetical protein